MDKSVGLIDDDAQTCPYEHPCAARLRAVVGERLANVAAGS
jgi:hypothetical protein